MAAGSRQGAELPDGGMAVSQVSCREDNQAS
ncbi:MAG: hypothetical protein JWP57_4044 [Spirosoma sp.]|nr:hypothetical protein [Spirosoma sp.]